MINPQRPYELLAFKLGEPTPALPALPIVRLLIADDIAAMPDLAPSVKRLLTGGCRYFMAWGEAAEQLHDAIDDILVIDQIESGDANKHRDVLTTWHTHDTVNDVVWFMLNLAILDQAKICCCIGYDEQATASASLLRFMTLAP